MIHMYVCMCAAEHAQLALCPIGQIELRMLTVFFWLSYAHVLGRAALGTGGEAGRLYFVYARWYCIASRGPLDAVQHATWLLSRPPQNVGLVFCFVSYWYFRISCRTKQDQGLLFIFSTGWFKHKTPNSFSCQCPRRC